MPPQQRHTTIHGVIVQQTQLQGKWYTPVDARVKIAEQADPGMIRREDASYNVVSVQFIQIAERWAYHCLVEYPAGSGVVKPGTDFIDTKDPSGVAKAETSAIGRALGLHGIAIEESIASADEMSRVTAQQADTDTTDEPAQPAPQSRQSAATRTAVPSSTPAQQRQPAASHSDAGRPTAARADEGATTTPPNEQQAAAIQRLSAALGRKSPVFHTYDEARQIIARLSDEVKQQRKGA